MTEIYNRFSKTLTPLIGISGLITLLFYRNPLSSIPLLSCPPIFYRPIFLADTPFRDPNAQKLPDLPDKPSYLLANFLN